VRGELGTLADAARSGELTLRGEFVLVVGEARGGAAADAAGDALPTALAEVERLVAAGSSRADAARQVAATTGIPRRRLYVAPDR
jgi:16S rRNA C1402 (ribose-2'-O) methylase RsmI